MSYMVQTQRLFRLAFAFAMFFIVFSISLSHVSAQAGLFDCQDFDSRFDAQEWFNDQGFSHTHDPYNLDGDDDGEVCEWGVDRDFEYTEEIVASDPSSSTINSENIEELELVYQACEDWDHERVMIWIELDLGRGIDFRNLTAADVERLNPSDRALYERERTLTDNINFKCGNANESIRTRVRDNNCIWAAGIIGDDRIVYGFPLSDDEIRALNAEELDYYHDYEELVARFERDCKHPGEPEYNHERRCALWSAIIEELTRAYQLPLSGNEFEPRMMIAEGALLIREEFITLHNEQC